MTPGCYCGLSTLPPNSYEPSSVVLNDGTLTLEFFYEQHFAVVDHLVTRAESPWLIRARPPTSSTLGLIERSRPRVRQSFALTVTPGGLPRVSYQAAEMAESSFATRRLLGFWMGVRAVT
jgi:hypothetical protein